MEITVQLVFTTNSLHVEVCADSEKVTSFEMESPSRPQVSGNAIEITFSDATVKEYADSELPVPLINAALTLQGRFGNHKDIRSPEAEAEALNVAQRLLSDEYVSGENGCQISTSYGSVRENKVSFLETFRKRDVLWMDVCKVEPGRFNSALTQGPAPSGENLLSYGTASAEDTVEFLISEAGLSPDQHNLLVHAISQLDMLDHLRAHCPSAGVVGVLDVWRKEHT